MSDGKDGRTGQIWTVKGDCSATCGAGNSQSPAGRRYALLCGHLRV